MLTQWRDEYPIGGIVDCADSNSWQAQKVIKDAKATEPEEDINDYENKIIDLKIGLNHQLPRVDLKVLGNIFKTSKCSDSMMKILKCISLLTVPMPLADSEVFEYSKK